MADDAIATIQVQGLPDEIQKVFTLIHCLIDSITIDNITIKNCSYNSCI